MLRNVHMCERDKCFPFLMAASAHLPVARPNPERRLSMDSRAGAGARAVRDQPPQTTLHKRA